MFGECDRSLKISELAGRSSSGVSGGGVALSPSVLQDDGGDFLAGDVYCTCQSQPPAPPSKKKLFSWASTHDVFGRSSSGASHANRFAKAPLSMFHPVERVIRAFGGKFDTAATSLASDEEWSVNLRHGIVPQLLFSSKFGGSPWWGVGLAVVMD